MSSTDPRYLLASSGVVTFGIETSAYEQASGAATEFGVTSEDIDPPNENPQTAMPTGGHGRQPYVNSPDPREHEIDVPAVVHNPDIPLECAIGERTTSGGTDDYGSHTFVESDRLETATLRHIQQDADLVAYYVGCKASLDVSWSMGDPLEMSLSWTAARHEFDPGESAPSFTPALDRSKSPYRSHMQGTVTLTSPDDDSNIKEIATVSGGDLSWDNGLEVQHHGDGREGYAVAETTAADKYDMSLTWNITDTDLYEQAANDGALVDIEIPFDRGMSSDGSTITDGIIITLEGCTVTDAPMHNPAEGILEGDVAVAPRNTTIEIREAA